MSQHDDGMAGPGLPEMGSLRRILLATDLSSISEPATDEALNLAARAHAELLIVSVIDQGDVSSGAQGARRMDQLRQDREMAARRVVEAARTRGVHATFLIWEGRAATALMEAAAAERVDLIVMGSHGRGPVGRLLFGSVSQAVARDAPCPVMVVRPGSRPVVFRAGTRAAR